jgi:PPOX class probable F420-dependent enzyme
MRLSRSEALGRLGGARVLTLATVDADGRPHQVPVVFALFEDRIVTAVDHKPKRTRDLRRLRNIAAEPRVCALADEYDEDWSRLWWVRVDGRARVLTEPALMRGPLASLTAKYPQYEGRTPEGPVIEITAERVTGWAYTDGG